MERESSAPGAAARRTAAMVTPNMFKDAPSDSAAIQSAVDFAASRGEPVLIPALNERTGASLWVISGTIGLPSGTALYLDNGRLRMADGVFCNCLSNAKAWIPARGDPANEEHDIHIVGVGNAVLDGGEFNGWGERARPGGAFRGDVRAHVASLPKNLVHNCPVYIHDVRRFSMRGVKVYHQRYWGMCFSVCSEGGIWGHHLRGRSRMGVRRRQYARSRSAAGHVREALGQERGTALASGPAAMTSSSRTFPASRRVTRSPSRTCRWAELRRPTRWKGWIPASTT